MAPSKLRFQLYDSEGNRFTVTLEGSVSRDKVLQILDLFELMGGLSSRPTAERQDSSSNAITKLERTRNVIQRRFPIGWFSSKDVQLAYEETCQEPIALSTVSTYLQRLSEGNFLLRSGSRAERRYRVSKSSQSLTKASKARVGSA